MKTRAKQIYKDLDRFIKKRMIIRYWLNHYLTVNNVGQKKMVVLPIEISP